MIKTRDYQNEKPVDTDLFGGQGHQQVASAIANVLLSDSTQNIIGIEGNLGAGKSTVINILQKHIIEKGFHVVTFDADQYHTDLKKALIKTIEYELEALLPKKDKDQRAKLTNAVEIALGKRLEYTKSTASHISFSAILFAFSLAVSALQVKPSLKFLFDFLNEAPDLDKLSGYISTGLFFSPVILYLFMKCRGSKTRLADLVKGNSIDTISERIDINKEVGAIELREAFKTFSALIPEGKALLLVIDNIDRLSPDVARELWSDIEILISLGSDRFRILLPYSEQHLAKALEKSAVDARQSGKEFISKHIPVLFSAPPIVTTGWRDQFKQYWEETLPDINGREGVKDLIEIWAHKITPRYLKSIVNRIGAKIDSCPESSKELNGTSCAAYLFVVKDEGLSINELLTQHNNENNTDKEITDIARKIKATHKVLIKHCREKDDYAKQIAALHYQTSFTIAQSELIAEPIHIAFKTLDGEKLLELSSLLGFELFFKKQIDKTVATQLVQITDAIVQKEGGTQLIEKYLADINHEINNKEYNGYSFDKALIESHLKLQNHNVNISLKLVKALQNEIIKEIVTVWDTVKKFKSPHDNGEYGWVNLEETVRQCHSYFQVIQALPDFIQNPEPSFVVNALFPIENELKQWNVRELIQKSPTESLVKAAVKRRKLNIEEVTIFPVILKKMRIRELQGLKKEDFLENIDIDSTDPSTLLDLLPFTGKWNSPEIKDIPPYLVRKLNMEQIDNSIIARYIALCCASLIKELTPRESIQFELNGRIYSQHSATWLADKLTEQADVTDHLTDYLSACSFKNILIWCKDEHAGKYILPHLEELIKNDRVHAMDITALLVTDYPFLIQKCKNITPKMMLDWMDDWHEFAKEPLNWHTEIVDDIIEHEPKNLLAVLVEYFDAKNRTKEEWLEQIKINHPTFEKIAAYLVNKGDALLHQKPLQEALKTIPEETYNYDVNLVTALTKLIDKNQQKSIRTTLTSRFFKNNTTQEQRYRLIRYFGSLIKMPSINDENTEMEVTALLEDAISKGHDEERKWLLKQPIDNSGWNLSKWTKENLAGLYDLLNAHPDTKNEKLTLRAAKILKNNTTDDAA